MKAETKNRIWDEVVRELNAGRSAGKSFKLRFVSDVRMITVEVVSGQRWTMSPDVAARLNGEAKAFIEAERKKAEAATRVWCEHRRQERETLDARLDEGGFTLVGGEETEIIASGTLRHCRDNLWRLPQYPRCPYAGRGCYTITDGDGLEVQAGEFDKDMVLS